MYSFSNTCAEDRTISLGDGAPKIFYNAAKHAIMPVGELRSFFRLLAGAADDGTAFSGRLAVMVERAKTNGQWRQQFMTWEQEMKHRAKEAAAKSYQEGCEDTRAEVAVETARILLSKNVAAEIIAEATRIPLEQVVQLQQELSAVEAGR